MQRYKTTGRHKVWSETELYNIRNDFVDGVRQEELAVKYKTTQKTISKIVNLKTYPEIGIPKNYANRYYKRTRKPLFPSEV